jgi:hypothetical protein
MKPIIFKHIIVLIMQCMSLVLISPAFAQAVLFNFDNARLYSSFPVGQTVSGITAQFTATGQGYSIQDANVLGFTPQGFSGRVIYPNSIYLADLLIKFDSKLTDFSIMYSCQELGCDDAATMRVTAFMNGSFIGTNTKTAANPGTWPVDVLSCSFPQGFDSLVIHYDSRPPTCQDYGVIFLADNMQVTAFGALPVTLIYFSCESRANTAILKWKSADEINLNSYIVQYSKNGSDFDDLATINAEGANRTYSFNHRVTGTAYYRLKLLDRDGAYKYSEIKNVTFKTKADVTIVSTPSNDYIHIYCDDPLDAKTIQIFSIHGVMLKTIRNYTAGKAITLSGLSKGVYVLKVFSLKDEVTFQKLFLKM